MLASAGILSLIIGLGAKDLVNDIIAGFFIIFEGTLKVGDFVTLGSWYGTVTQVGLRTTKITFFADTKIINNSAIKDIINTNGDAARRKIKFPIPYDVDLLYVEEILERELPLLTGKIPALLKPPKYGGVSSIEDSCILLRITVFAKPYKANKVQRAVLRELILIFDRYGIDIPYQQITIHNASGEHHGVRENNEEESVPDDTYTVKLEKINKED